MKQALAALLMALSLSCSIFRPRPAPYPDGVVFPLAEAARVDFKSRVLRSLVNSGGKLYFSTDKGVLYCLDERGRKILWTYDAQSALGCPPAVGPDVIAVWDANSTIHAVSPEGSALWKTQLPGAASSDIFLARDKLYVGTREGSLYALSRLTGEVLWEFKTGGAIEAACAAWYDLVVQASTDGLIYFIGPDGKLRSKWEAGAAIRVTPLAEGGQLYFGADDSSFSCLDLKWRQRKWRLRAEGKILATPRADGKRVYFTASNTVLYGVNKRSGDIDWWRILPSRSSFSPEVAGDKILASSDSPLLVGLELKTGQEAGRYDTGLEVRSGPLWSPPDVLIAIYDFGADKGSLVSLQKQVKVDLSASMTGRAAVGAEVVFTASAVGFYLPKYEFYIERDGKETVAQEESAQNSWTWFPERAGRVTIGVRVRDARESREAEMSFDVTETK